MSDDPRPPRSWPIELPPSLATLVSGRVWERATAGPSDSAVYRLHHGAAGDAAARRWARFDPRRTLARRQDAALPFANLYERAGQPLLLDTGVYIDRMQGRGPDLIERLVDARQINHSTVTVQALMRTVGVLDPDDPRTAAVAKSVTDQIQAMPEHRLFTPDAEVLGRAALLAGILSRLRGYARDARLRALQDCVLFLQARKLGFAVLTANLAEFDLLLQLMPACRVLFYRPGP